MHAQQLIFVQIMLYIRIFMSLLFVTALCLSSLNSNLKSRSVLQQQNPLWIHIRTRNLHRLKVIYRSSLIPEVSSVYVLVASSPHAGSPLLACMTAYDLWGLPSVCTIEHTTFKPQRSYIQLCTQGRARRQC